MSSGHQQSNKKAVNLDALRQSLDHPDWHQRLHAAKTLGEQGTQAQAAVPDLLTLLADQNETVIGTVMIALSKIKPGTPNVIQPLIELSLAKSESLTDMAIFCIIKLVPHNQHFLPALINRLKQAGPFDRCRIIELIGQIGPQANAAYPALFHILQADLAEDFAFNYTLEALNKIGLPRASDLVQLMDLFKDELGRPRLFVLPGFDKTNMKIINHVLPVFEEVVDRIYYCHYQLITLIASSQIGSTDLVQSLIQSLQHPAKTVRRYAAECFAFIGPPAYEAVPALITSLKDPHAEVRFYAAEALGYIGATAYHALPALTEAGHDDDPAVRDCAKEASQKIHGHSAI